jgi:hypothetical protein
VNHSVRIGQLRRRITKAGLSGLLVTHLPDLRYLSGFTGSSAALAVTRRAARLFTDGRYSSQAAEEVQSAQIEIISGSPSTAAVQWLAAQPGATTAGFDPAWTTVADLTRWKAALPPRLRRSFLSTLAVLGWRWYFVRHHHRRRLLQERVCRQKAAEARYDRNNGDGCDLDFGRIVKIGGDGGAKISRRLAQASCRGPKISRRFVQIIRDNRPEIFGRLAQISRGGYAKIS